MADNRSINYFKRALIAVLTHISFALCYRCRGVRALGSNESPEMCVRRISVFRTSANGRGSNLTYDYVRGRTDGH